MKNLCLTLFLLMFLFSGLAGLTAQSGTLIAGDANENGMTDIVDALLVAQYSVEIPVNINLIAADVNCDQSINIIDALLIAQYSVGAVSELCITAQPTITPTTQTGNRTPAPTRLPIVYSSKIRLNQAGYTINETEKSAIVANMTGSFTIHNYYTDAQVFSGTLSQLGADSNTGETLYLADFSNLKQDGVFYLKVSTEKSARFILKNDIYDEMLYYTLRVYGANRCGPYDSWIHDACHEKDGSIRGSNKSGSLTGGWHDCGDHVKFGQTLGYATVMLLYSYIAWPSSFQDVYGMSYNGTYYNPSPDGIPDVINEAKVGTDYLLNLYNASVEDGLISKNQMYYQVGDGDEDHSWWHKPEFQDSFGQSKGGAPREVWSDISSSIAGRFAASLAMMAVIYKKYDNAYATNCLTAAKAIYEIGKAKYGMSGLDSGGKGYYSMDGRADDDMALAGTMLYKAANDDYYINQTTGAQYWMAVEKKWQFQSYYVLSFPNIFAIALHAYYPYASTVDNDPSVVDTQIVTKSECIEWLKADAVNFSASPDLYGRRWQYGWGTCRYMMGVAATAALAHDLDPTDSQMLKIAKDQLHWVFGKNQFGLSFVIGNTKDGWLTKYPQHPHHRAANPDGKNVPELPMYDPTELTGSTIGGPSGPTKFSDQWDDYTSTETGIDYWAGTFFTIAYLAKIK